MSSVHVIFRATLRIGGRLESGPTLTARAIEDSPSPAAWTLDRRLDDRPGIRHGSA